MAVGVLVLFAAAIHPLTPRDFYRTFLQNLSHSDDAAAGRLVEQARQRQAQRPDLYPATALLEAADEEGVSLRELTKFSDAADNSEVIALIRKRASGSIRLGLDLNGGVEFILRLDPDYDALAEGGLNRENAEAKLQRNFKTYRDSAMEALRRRLETQNIFEAELAPFAGYGLSLKAPLVSPDEKDKLGRLIKMSNKLGFHLVHPRSAELLERGRRFAAPPGYMVLQEEQARGASGTAPSYVVARRPEMTGSGIDQAFVSRNQFGSLTIALRFNDRGARDFAAVTRSNIGRQLAIVLDGKLYCAPVIKSAISGGQAEISGSFSAEEAQEIAGALSCGSFPFRIDVEAVYDTDPTLGADNVRNGIWAGAMALVLLAAFMIVYYRWAGVIAVTALAANVVLILGALAAFNATLTMPGIAGIILTLGMAVDANVLIFERMREETEAGKPPATVVESGFRRACSAVLDGNLTTLVVALILMYFGTGAVRGFAVSLSIGILSSLFTSLFMSRVIFDWLLRWNPRRRFTMLKLFSRPDIDFIRWSRGAILLSSGAIVLSFAAFFWQGEDMLSVDFTGGTLLSFDYDRRVPVADLENTLAAHGFDAKISYKSNSSRSDNRKLEILLRRGAEKHLDLGAGDMRAGVQQLLNHDYPGLKLGSGQSTLIGGMVGMEMTRNAAVSIFLAFLGMIVYVALRYELVYALCGIAALVHDAIVALGIYVLLGREMSLPVVAGVLTIIGYSINDTIVIFDRIREESALHPERPFAETVNESLNRTLSRTMLTSITTFLVVLVMLLFGGIAINDFMLIIALGIVIGTYSSVCIAAPLVVIFRRRKRSGMKPVGRAEQQLQ